MSLITKCPACNTMFRVVPDQLRISGGWVRCGNCDEVFDGNSHLQPLPNHAEAAAPHVPPSPSFSPPAAVPSSSAEELLARPAQPSPVEPLQATADGGLDPSGEPAPLSPDPTGEPDPLRVASVDPFLELRPREHIDLTVAPVADELHLSALGDVAPAAPATPRYVQAERTEPKGGGNHPQLSFMRQPQPRQRGEGVLRSRSWAGALLSAVLLVGLGAQFVWHERDALAAAQPAARPALDAMCAVLACELHAYRQIESVVIENSGFAKVRAETYRLSVTLRNTAPVPIAVPALELTLTDALDQPLIRRILVPGELAKNQATIAAGGEVNVMLPLGVADRAGRPHFTGYRVLAFYP